jgi:predicted AlkP superfamily phosphohydrolase/phosphomutase
MEKNVNSLEMGEYMEEKRTKVLVIGLDGAPYDLIKRLSNQGKIPNITNAIENGVFGKLTSTIPPVSPTAWSSFMTGKNPGKHGIFDHGVKREGTYDFRSGTPMEGKSLWTILSEAEKKVGVVRVPKTYPPEHVNGFMVTPQVTSFPEATYPTSLERELKQEIEDFEASLKVPYPPGKEKDFIEDLRRSVKKKANETLYLMERYEWDFFMTVFFDGDTVQHFFWKYLDPNHPLYDSKEAEKFGDIIINYYELIDDVIGNIFKRIENDTTIVIMSDHGAGSVYKNFYINEWLQTLGLLKLNEKPKTEFLTEETLIQNKFVQSLFSLLMKLIPFPFLKKRLFKAAYSLVPSASFLPDINWPNTKVYSTGGGGYCSIFINLEGSAPQGTVKPGKEYEQLRSQITNILYELKDPKTNEKIIDKVYKREELYEGPNSIKAPDLLGVIKDFSYSALSSCRSEGGAFFVPLTKTDLSGVHRLNGTFIIKGPHIKKGVEIKKAKIIDLVPTILHLMNVPAPLDIDGSVLKEIFKPDSPLVKRKTEYQPPSVEKEKRYLSEEDEEKIKERLKRLGYIG